MFKIEKKGDGDSKPKAKTSQSPKKVILYDGVKQDAIYRENVEQANRARKDWERNWAFLAEFDTKGEIKAKEKMPENLSVFSDKLPETAGHQYGHRLKTEIGQQLQRFEYNFYKDSRRSKSADLVTCE